MNTLTALKRSSLGLDLYLWLVYRTFPLRAPLRLTCRQVYRQFGAHPDNAHDKKTVQNFRIKVLHELKKIKLSWPGLNYSTAPRVLILHPSTPVIAPGGPGGPFWTSRLPYAPYPAAAHDRVCSPLWFLSWVRGRMTYADQHDSTVKQRKGEMATNGNEKPDWFTVFRTDTDEENAGWLYTELTEGRLRQGWGAPGFALETADGRRVEKTQWEAAYKAHWEEDPSLRRFAILTRMLDMEDGGVVVVPKILEKGYTPGSRQVTAGAKDGMESWPW